MKILRSIGGVIAGVIVAGILVFAVQMIGHVVYPPPGGIDPSTSEGQKALADYIAKAPLGVFLFVLASYAVGTAVGAWLAAKIAGRAHIVHGLVVGGIQLVFGIVNLMMIRHPVWFAVVSVVTFPAAAFLGGLFARGKGVC